jgi:hypothetical protein
MTSVMWVVTIVIPHRIFSVMFTGGCVVARAASAVPYRAAAECWIVRLHGR